MTTIIQPLTRVSDFGPNPALVAGTTQDLLFSGGAGFSTEIVTPTGGEVFGWEWMTQVVLTAGTISLQTLVNDVPIGAPIIGIGPAQRLATFVPNPNKDRFRAGQLLGVQAAASNTMLPSPSVFVVTIYVIFNRGVSTDADGI